MRQGPVLSFASFLARFPFARAPNTAAELTVATYDDTADAPGKSLGLFVAPSQDGI
jgi:hypothetical protein